MTRVLRSATKNIQSKEDLSSNLSVSKSSKIIKRRYKKAIEVKNEDIKQNDIWNINSILCNIFTYTDHKDLLEFNTVCKKWNNITNPIIHKTIKLYNRRDDSVRYCYKRINNVAKIDEEIKEFISNNSKHAHLVKGFKFNYKMRPLRAIEVFETFRFITNLTIENCNMAQGQFLGMIRPLNQLQELDLRSLNIKNSFKKKLYKEVVQLPSPLKKLRLGYIKLIDNPELFVQTINSHSNLVEFASVANESSVFLEPFYKHYPSLLDFELYNTQLESSQSLFKTFDSNPQLVSLKLTLKYMSSEMVRHICSYLIKLEDLNLRELYGCSSDNTDINLKFPQPSKIKKLGLEWSRLGNCTLDSILINCPHLKELDLNPFKFFEKFNYIKYINLINPEKIKKLVIHCGNLDGSAFDLIILNFHHLSELVINLPVNLKGVIKSICEKFEKLHKLEIIPPKLNISKNDVLYQEFYESELFSSNSKCNSTLTNLTLNRFKAIESKAEYFKNFENLKSIKYLNQLKIYNNGLIQENEIDMDLWPGYKTIKKYNGHKYDIEFKKTLI